MPKFNKILSFEFFCYFKNCYSLETVDQVQPWSGFKGIQGGLLSYSMVIALKLFLLEAALAWAIINLPYLTHLFPRRCTLCLTFDPLDSPGLTLLLHSYDVINIIFELLLNHCYYHSLRMDVWSGFKGIQVHIR